MCSNSTYLGLTLTWKDSPAAKGTETVFHTEVKRLFLHRELGVQLCQLGQRIFYGHCPIFADDAGCTADWDCNCFANCGDIKGT